MTASVLSVYAESLIEVVARVDGLPSEQVRTSRDRRSAHARQAVMFVLRERGYGYEEIGREFGLDHTTVHHAVGRLAKLVNADQETRYIVAELRAVHVPRPIVVRQAEKSPLIDLARALVARIDQFVADVEYAKVVREQLQALIELDEQVAV